MVVTAPIRININCKKHGNEFYKEPTCKACQFLLDYSRRRMALVTELEKLTAELEKFMTVNEIVAVEFQGKAMTGVV